MTIDESILDLLEKFRTPLLTSFFKGITFFGSAPLVIAISIGVTLLLVVKKRNWTAIAFSCLTIIDALLTYIIKNLTERSRPDVLERLARETSYSLPSGHSSSSILLYGAILALTLPYVRSRGSRFALTCLTTLWILLIGLSRMYLGVHYPTDVLLGFLLGAVMLIIFLKEGHIKKPTRNVSLKSK